MIFPEASSGQSALSAALEWGARRLRAAGIESPRRESRLLLAHALGVEPEDIVSGRASWPSAPAPGLFRAAIARRAAREPLAYILGRKEFFSLDFHIGPEVLIPRPESEILVEEALRRFPAKEARLSVLDLGTGSGCLLLAFLSERPNATGAGVDISEGALAIARRNAETLGLAGRAKFLRSDWTAAVSGRFHVVFANPPYIARSEWPLLAPELAYEPTSALDGGPDGLAAYRRIADGLAGLLAPEGWAFLEVGKGQAESVGTLFMEKGLDWAGTVSDLAGIPRCVVVGATGTASAKKTFGMDKAKRLVSAPGYCRGERPPRGAEEPEKASA